MANRRRPGETRRPRLPKTRRPRLHGARPTSRSRRPRPLPRRRLTTTLARAGGSHLLEGLDAVLEGRVGVEGTVEPRAFLTFGAVERLLDPHLRSGAGRVVHDGF